MSFGLSLTGLPYTEFNQPYWFSQKSEKSGSSVQNLNLKCLNLDKYPIIAFSRSRCPFCGCDLKDDIVMTAVLTSNCPRVTAHWIEPIND